MIILDFVDNGPPFDPTRAPLAVLPADLDAAKAGGHGLRLIRHYLDDIRYDRRSRRNHLRLVRYLSPDTRD